MVASRSLLAFGGWAAPPFMKVIMGLARAMLDFTASGDFEAHWETIVDKARLSPHEARRSRQQRLTNIERDPSDPY